MTEWSPQAGRVASQVLFAIVPEWVLYGALSDKALRVYAVLNRFANNETHRAWPGHRAIAIRARCSVSSVKRALRELETFGAIEIEHRFNEDGSPTSNEYLVRVTRGGAADEPSTQGSRERRSRAPDDPADGASADYKREPFEREPVERETKAASPQVDEESGLDSLPSDLDEWPAVWPAPAPSDQQAYLCGRLCEIDSKFLALTTSAIISLNKRYGRTAVLHGLRAIYEEILNGKEVIAPYALLEAISRDRASERVPSGKE